VSQLLIGDRYRLEDELGRRYRTYDCYVANEVRDVLEKPEDFSNGPSMWIPHVVQDGKLITSRWPWDAAAFSRRFAQAVEGCLAARDSAAPKPWLPSGERIPGFCGFSWSWF
jgi:hypothetical protein